jgi:hypothetical protein
MINKVDTFGAPVFAPDYGASVLAAETCTNSHDHSVYIRFLRLQTESVTNSLSSFCRKIASQNSRFRRNGLFLRRLLILSRHVLMKYKTVPYFYLFVRKIRSDR